jgi:hypothetical protein
MYDVQHTIYDVGISVTRGARLEGSLSDYDLPWELQHTTTKTILTIKPLELTHSTNPISAFVNQSSAFVNEAYTICKKVIRPM